MQTDRISSKRFDVLLKNFTGGPILSFCKDLLFLRPEMTSLQKITRSTADAVERPSPAYLLRAAGIDENT